MTDEMSDRADKSDWLTRSVDERFWQKVDKSGDCWQWTGGTTNGYGRFGLSTNLHPYAHRFAYERLVGPIPEGLELDHLCENTGCVNPDHLEAVTSRVNTLRSYARSRARRAT